MLFVDIVCDCCQRYWMMLTAVRPRKSSAANTISTRQRQRQNERIGLAFSRSSASNRPARGLALIDLLTCQSAVVLAASVGDRDRVPVLGHVLADLGRTRH
jgi:hypothetical protein